MKKACPVLANHIKNLVRYLAEGASKKSIVINHWICSIAGEYVLGHLCLPLDHLDTQRSFNRKRSANMRQATKYSVKYDGVDI